MLHFIIKLCRHRYKHFPIEQTTELSVYNYATAFDLNFPRGPSEDTAGFDWPPFAATTSVNPGTHERAQDVLGATERLKSRLCMLYLFHLYNL